MAQIYLALGSNLGDRLQNLRDAVEQLSPQVRVTKISGVYDTAPWGVIEQPRFLNLVLAGETELAPIQVLRLLKEIERAMGRQETVRYGPRVIDLDVLLYDDVIFENEVLQIPHPRMHERRFVLEPLAEISPEVVHPKLKKSARELLDDLSAAIRKLADAQK